jgi:hypothetical protein
MINTPEWQILKEITDRIIEQQRTISQAKTEIKRLKKQEKAIQRSMQRTLDAEWLASETLMKAREALGHPEPIDDDDEGLDYSNEPDLSLAEAIANQEATERRLAISDIRQQAIECGLIAE